MAREMFGEKRKSYFFGNASVSEIDAEAGSFFTETCLPMNCLFWKFLSPKIYNLFGTPGGYKCARLVV